MVSNRSVDVGLWVQIVTVMSLVAGIALVWWELEQTRDLVKVQMSQATFSDITQDLSSQYGDSVAETLARACFTPDDITQADMFVLDSVFRAQTYRIRRFKAQSDRAGYYSFWQDAAVVAAEYILRFPHGRKWLEAHANRDQQVQQHFRELARSLQVTPCGDELDGIFRPQGIAAAAPDQEISNAR